MFEWSFDAFFWLVLPVAVFEAIRIVRLERKRPFRSLPAAVAFGAVELALLALCAGTDSPLMFVALAVFRMGLVSLREAMWWGRRMVKTTLIGLAFLPMVFLGRVTTFSGIAGTSLGPTWRIAILVLICAVCVAAILPVRVSDESKETLAAPIAFVAFARVALPLGATVPQFSVIVPIVAAGLGLLCALWLLSAGSRANHFEASTLVSEILVCERGVVLSFVWLGLSSGEHLSSVGALLQWWSGTLALIALEASLRQRPLPKPMAFFALALAISLPGTMGFVAEDLLAHGLLELRPVLAAAFVVVVAINAASLYLAIVNIVVDLRAQHLRARPNTPPPPEQRPSFMMLGAAGLSVLIGIVPGPFVQHATKAHAAVAAFNPVDHGGH